MTEITPLQIFIDTLMKPLLYDASNIVFNSALIIATFFSVLFYLIAIDGMFSKRRERNKESHVNEWPFVTVQIPTYNEPVAIRCAEKCMAFDYPKDRFEILIGDDSADKAVSRMIKEFADRNKEAVKVIRRQKNEGFKPGNLNNLLGYSKGEIIVIFDSDFVAPKNFLKRIVKPFIENKNVAGVQARWDFLNSNHNLVSKLASSIMMVYHHLWMPLINKNGISFICGSAEAVRKDAIIELGGWQNGSLTEDIEFSLRMLQSGYKITYISDLKGYGEVPYNLEGFRKQQMRWAYGNTKAFLQHAKGILSSDLFSVKQKLLISFVLLGYVTAPIVALLFVSGLISFITHEPGPIDLPKFFSSMGRNVFLTSGFIVAGLVALSKEGKLNLAVPIILSSFTIGVIVSFSVSSGFFKAILRKPMRWYMIKKIGNEKIANKVALNSYSA